MGMVVRTNTMALNAYRQLGMNNSAVAKSLEKLSSGFRINRAADDAAGLAISEKMKAQIKGLETASSNAQDGISLLQTAEGNLAEVHNMLNRMVELATKSANGTYSLTERTALQDEVDALLDEVNRISKSANFNGINLLDGSMGLNGDTFELAGPTAAADGADLTSKLTLAASTETDTTKLHLGTKNIEQVGPSFSIDLADLALNAGTAGDAKVEITIGGSKLESGNLGATAKTAADIRDAIFANSSSWTGKGKVAGNMKIGNVEFKVEKEGDTGLKFTYAGDTANTTPAATDILKTADVTAINAAIGGGVTVAVTDSTGGSHVGDINHDTMNVVAAVEQKLGARAGIDVKLEDDLIAIGNSITIDGKTFTFVAQDKDTTLGENEIGIDSSLDLSKAADMAKAKASIVDQLSHKSTTNFRIESAGDDTIHIDQLVGNTEVYDTYDKLKDLFSAQAAGTPAGNKLNVKGTIKDGDSLTIGGKTYTFSKDGTGTNDKVNYVKVGANSAESLTNLQTALKDNGVKADVTADSITVYGEKVAGGGLTLQIGDTAADFNKMTVAVNDMSASGLGIDGLNIKTANSASDAIDTIKTAINTVSSTRAGMGALQNRLEYTINNLDVAVENLSAANSRIRDTDMAKEMMNYTKMNVLVQSAQAMLAQANQQPQSVLQLLQ